MRVGQHPQAEADQEVRQQDQQIGDDRERHQARQRRDQVGRAGRASRRTMTPAASRMPSVFMTLLAAMTAAALILVGLLLQHGVQRHAVEAAEESEQAEADRGGGIAAVDAGQHKRADRHADGADRHQAQFDLVSGEPAGRQAADRRCRSRSRRPSGRSASFRSGAMPRVSTANTGISFCTSAPTNQK